MSLIASCNCSLAGLGFSSSSVLLPGASLESASALGGTLHMPVQLLGMHGGSVVQRRSFYSEVMTQVWTAQEIAECRIRHSCTGR